MDYESRAFEDRAALKGRMVYGFAAVFNTRTQLAPGIQEQIAPGAFAQSIKEDDPIFTFQHDPAALLARKSAGTLRLEERSRGLFMEADLPETNLGNDIRELMARGDLRAASFRFRSPPESEKWETLPDGSELRTLQALRLIDVTVTPLPQYADATLALRSRDTHRDALVIPAVIVRRHRLLSMKQSEQEKW